MNKLDTLIDIWGNSSTMEINHLLKQKNYSELRKTINQIHNIRLFQYIFNNFVDVYEEYIKYRKLGQFRCNTEFIADVKEANILKKICKNPKKAILYIHSNQHHVYALANLIIQDKIRLD